MIFHMKQVNFWLSLAIAMAANNTNAQNLIKGAGTDAQFANTTVVLKDSTASDLDVLNQLNNSDLGIGDVVRITTPPPAAKTTAPVAVKRAANVNVPTVTRKPDTKAANNTGMVASTDNPVLMLATITNAPKVQPSNPRPAKTNTTVITPRITPSLVENDRDKTSTVKSQATSAAAKSTKSGNSLRSAKSVKKGHKKAAQRHNTPRKYKARGKQRYDCYQF
jgi:hypothetical protein